MKSSASLLLLGFFFISAPFLHADELNVLGTANNFAVLSATTVTNTGSTVLGGDLGVSPGSAITGFPPGGFSSGVEVGSAVSTQGEADALSAFNVLSGLPFTGNLTGQDLGELVLTPGVYFFSSSAELTGQLTLDFEGLSNASFVFQTGSTLTTASGSDMDVINEGANDSIYWAVGSSATLGTTTAFEGTLIADQSITLTTGATIGCGSAIALNGAVTLDSNVIGGGCSTGDSSSPVTPSAVPEPESFGLMATGLLGALGVVRRRISV